MPSGVRGGADDPLHELILDAAFSIPAGEIFQHALFASVKSAGQGAGIPVD